jgi:uncharacterized membrane protein YedE/YeeE
MRVRSARQWRLPFIVGLVLGGFLSAVLGGGFAPTWDLGMFDQVIGFGHPGKLAWMFVGGLFIGFGTRLAGGCTAVTASSASRTSSSRASSRHSASWPRAS